MTTPNYPAVSPNPNFAELEEEILRFWKTERVFEQSVENRPSMLGGANNEYVFYDGPPFANGLPHYGHLLTGYVKDAVARYQTMRGKRVERRFGWDCHGLPAEMGAEKELGISGRAAITEYGIGKFNEHCRTSVMKYTADWEYYVNRQGRWVDFKNDYKTMDTPFMESCLWAFKELYNKGLIYESMRVMPYSWAAETPVSNFETRIDNATREREDKAAYVKFKLTAESAATLKAKGAPEADNYYLIAWTTTPWTLPSNLALAVNAEMDYTFIINNNECMITEQKSARKLFKEAEETFIRLGAPVFDENGKLKDELSSADQKKVSAALDNTVRFDKNFVGGNLIGLTYEPLFPYFADTANAFRVLDGSEFVTDGDGTGIVHMAPGFGEVDQACCAQNAIEVIVPVDEKGRFTDAIFDIEECPHPNPLPEGEGGTRASGRVRGLRLKGLNVIAEKNSEESDLEGMDPRKIDKYKEHISKYGLANMRIIRWLDERGYLVKQEEIKHNYPHCWRTDTPLIYRAMSSWYVNVQKIKANMAENNLTIHWIPDHIQSGQMGKGIESAPDWSISRNRFWGTPIPIWKSASGKIHVCGSIEEIERLSGKKVADLHRPYIDEVVLKIDGEEYTRIEDVFDCWFESGSMPYAQLHYPFENKELFEKNFPADFITEYIAQTRGWFYTLQVLSAGLFNKAPFLEAKGIKHSAPFKNVICHGVVIDEETGLKYSKRLKNYRDPKEVMDQFGADALRWMMLASPVMRGADLGVDPDGKFIRDVVRLNIKPIWNAYNFFTLYANADGIKGHDLLCPHPNPLPEGEGMSAAMGEGGDILDRYILAKCRAAVKLVKSSLDAYDTPSACEAITAFFEVLNNWYIRRSKDRFWGDEKSADKQAAYDTLFTVLNVMCKAAAPLLPFTTEAIYRGLNGEFESVHLQDFPDVSGIAEEDELLTYMDRVRDVCNSALAIRNKLNIRVRQPLSELRLEGHFASSVVSFAEDIIKDEVNVKRVFSANTDFAEFATFKVALNNAVLGKRLPEKMKQIIPAAKKGEYEDISHNMIKICGEILMPNEFSMMFDPKPEYKDRAQPLSTNDSLVILDLTITPELEAEGLARDLVRMIQQARKDSGFDVSDRIALSLDLPNSFVAALSHREYIATQTLAVSLTEGKDATAQKQVTQEFEGETITIGLSKAS